MIDIMLINQTNIDNPLVKSPESNAFAIRSLMKVPLDLFSKKDRIRIRQGWLHAHKTHKTKKKDSSKEDNATSPSYELTALNPEVLALKIKILQLSISYEVSIVNDIPLLHADQF